MWKLGNRLVIVLVCVLSGSVILYNIWGSALAVIITLLLVIYASILLLTSDIHQTPHALLLLEYFKRAGEELYNLLQNISHQTTIYAINLIEIAKKFYENYIITRMDRHHRNTYQLSTDTFINSNRNTEFNMVDGLTPIIKNRRGSYISGSENNCGIDLENARGYNGNGGGGSSSNSSGRSLDKVTSTPLVQWERRQSHNGGINNRNLHINTINHQSPLKRSSSLQFNDNNMLREEETVYTPRGSPWGTSISPKMRSKAAGVKTVQTVAGPLLTSTRYNIDPKVYNDVTSPGLTSRLAKYATEANMKLSHQSQYLAGQFPKVNLNASPTPIINARSPRGRTSVTVRVAPPEITKYSSPERQKILSSVCQTNNKSPTSVVQVLKEISLKRHASSDDMTMELAKKQRTDGIHNDESENYEEITQKRGRDDSSKSESEVSIDNTSLRPIKRTKIPSCYDILNSLSSSTNVSSGVKRKADISRSGTPDIGKHFKSLDNIQRSRSVPISPQQNAIFRSQSDLTDNRLDDNLSSNKLLHSVSPKVISPFTNTLKKITAENEKKLNSNNASVKLTDRLFMRAEPQNIDKLKSLIEEHGNVSSKFTDDDGEEIKKSDVVIMRQTSMKVRLQSMFDAISGKISGQIDPNVVIQAEQVNSSTSVSTISSSSSSLLLNQQSSSTLTTLNSSTSTTSINTSPISTSAVIPIIGKTKTSITPGKHVTFLLPTSTQMPNNESVLSTTTKSSISLPSTNLQQKSDEGQKSETKNSTVSLPLLSSVSSPANSISLPTFSLNSNNVTSTAVNTTIVSTPTSTINLSSTHCNNSLLLTPTSSKSPTTIAFGASQFNMQPIQTSTPINFTMTSEKPIVVTATTASFTFGTSPIVSTATTNSHTSSTVITPSTSMPGFQSTITTPSTSILTTPSTNLFSTNKSSMSTSFTGTTNTASSSITTPTFSFGQSYSNPSLLQSTTNTSTQGGFTFGMKNVSNVNLTTATTTTTITTTPTTINQLDISTNSQSLATATSPSFTLGVNPLNTSALTFGTNIPTASKTLMTCDSNNPMANTTTTSTPATTSSSMFSFGVTPATTKPVFSFGTPNNSQTTSANNPISFGTSSQPSMFGSGVNNSSTPITTSAQNESTFGTITTTNSQPYVTTSSNAMPFTFGTANVQQSTFPSTTSSTSNGNATNSQFDITLKTKEIPNFNMNSNVPTTKSTSLFNNTNSGNSIFGQSKIIPSTGAFGTSSSASSNFITNTNNTFGNSGQSLSFQQPTTTVGFGASSSVISMSGSTFGSPNLTSSAVTSSSAATSAPTAFGTANLSSTSSGFGTLKSIVPSFGAGSNNFAIGRPAEQLFGSQNQNTASSFGGNTSVFGTGAPTTTAPPRAFGDSTSSTPVFGTSGGFNNANSSVPAFSNPVSNTGFSSGYGSTTSTNQISPFGNQSSNTPAFGNTNTSVSSFGTVSNNNPNSSSSGGFSFGRTSTNQSQQQNAPFTFGGVNTNSNNNTVPSAGAPFQFNATPTPQIGGFNFTGGVVQPTFGGSSASGSSTGSSGGMFSIGSGSTAPRSRSTRPRRQQR